MPPRPPSSRHRQAWWSSTASAQLSSPALVAGLSCNYRLLLLIVALIESLEGDGNGSCGRVHDCHAQFREEGGEDRGDGEGEGGCGERTDQILEWLAERKRWSDILREAALEKVAQVAASASAANTAAMAGAPLPLFKVNGLSRQGLVIGGKDVCNQSGDFGNHNHCTVKLVIRKQDLTRKQG